MAARVPGTLAQVVGVICHAQKHVGHVEAGERCGRGRGPRRAVPQRRGQRAELEVTGRLCLLRQNVPHVQPDVRPELDLVLALYLGGIVFQNVISEEACPAIGRLKVVSGPDAKAADYRETGDVQGIGRAERIVIDHRGVAG